MSADLESLARRAVACKHWRWMPGMLTTLGLRIDAVDKRGEPYRSGRYYDGAGELQQTREHEPEPLPDFSDPATLGCVLALVREALGGAVWVEPQRDGSWCVLKMNGLYCTPLGSRSFSCASALVAALEAAP